MASGFHTGDAVIEDAAGNVAFVDRIKDCIRRRGENIAANDVEAALLGVAGIGEIAAFAVPTSRPCLPSLSVQWLSATVIRRQCP